MEDLNEPINKIGSIDESGTLHHRTTEYSFFSSIHRTFTKIDPILSPKCKQIWKYSNYTEYAFWPYFSF